MERNRSECVAELVKALSAASTEFPALVADKTAEVNGKARYSYDYADLASVLEVIRGPLAKHELGIVQLPTREGADVVVETILSHSSGEWISNRLSLPAGAGAQAVGSAITYARRYSLLAMVGLAPDDDDGAAAQQAAAKLPQRQPEQAEHKPTAFHDVDVVKQRIAAVKDTAGIDKAGKWLDEQIREQRIRREDATPLKIAWLRRAVVVAESVERLESLRGRLSEAVSRGSIEDELAERLLETINEKIDVIERVDAEPVDDDEYFATTHGVE